jgi:CHAT domain-containing protein
MAPDPIYLLVRQEGRTSSEIAFRTSVLGAGGKATVVSGVRRMKKKALDDKLAALESASFNFQRAPAFGRDLAAMVIAEEARSVLAALKDRHVVVVHDAESSRIPWETLATQATRADWLFAKEAGVSRRYVADHLSVARWLEERRQDAVLNVLLVVNPTRDLPGAEKEGKRILEILGTEPAARIDVLRGEEATRAALEKAFRSGTYDVIHYAGHAFFDVTDPGNSGILCAGKVVLSGRDLVGLGNLPALVFFNACEAGRVRRAPARGTPPAPTMRQRIDANVGLAEAFLRGGVANYVGTYWPVGDDPAKLFAVWETGSVDWADYIHYGSHNFVLKIR